MFDNINFIMDEYKQLTEDQRISIKQLQESNKAMISAINEVVKNAIVTVEKGQNVKYRVSASSIEGLYKAVLGEH